MSEQNGNGHNSQVYRFDGILADKYEGWKLWSRAHLMRCEAKGMTEKGFGAELLSLLVPDSPAFNAIKELGFMTICSRNGHQRIYEVLDARYPVKDQMDKLGEHLRDAHHLAPLKDEQSAAYTGRALGIFAKLIGHGVTYPEEAKGFMILEALDLAISERATVMALARGTYKSDAITGAIRKAYPTVLPVPQKKHKAHHQYLTEKHIYSNDDTMSTMSTCADTDAASTVAETEADSEVGEIDTYITEVEYEENHAVLIDLMEPASENRYEEEKVHQVLVSWQKARKNIAKSKLARKFVSTKPRMQDIKRKVLCWNCRKEGHMSRECKEPRKVDPSRKGKGKGNSLYFVVPEAISEIFLVDVVFGLKPANRVTDEIVFGPKPIEVTTGNPALMSEDGPFFNRQPIVTDTTVGETLQITPECCPCEASTKVRETFGHVVKAIYMISNVNEDSLILNYHLHPHVSKAGRGTVDNGAGGNIIGVETLEIYEKHLWERFGLGILEVPDAEPLAFRFGNGEISYSLKTVDIPCGIKGKHFVILRAHVVAGGAPLLVSVKSQKALRFVIDSEQNSIFSKSMNESFTSEELPTGHLHVVLDEFPSVSKLRSLPPPEVITPETELYKNVHLLSDGPESNKSRWEIQSILTAQIQENDNDVEVWQEWIDNPPWENPQDDTATEAEPAPEDLDEDLHSFVSHPPWMPNYGGRMGPCSKCEQYGRDEDSDSEDGHDHGPLLDPSSRFVHACRHNCPICADQKAEYEKQQREEKKRREEELERSIGGDDGPFDESPESWWKSITKSTEEVSELEGECYYAEPDDEVEEMADDEEFGDGDKDTLSAKEIRSRTAHAQLLYQVHEHMEEISVTPDPGKIIVLEMGNGTFTGFRLRTWKGWTGFRPSDISQQRVMEHVINQHGTKLLIIRECHHEIDDHKKRNWLYALQLWSQTIKDDYDCDVWIDVFEKDEKSEEHGYHLHEFLEPTTEDVSGRRKVWTTIEELGGWIKKGGPAKFKESRLSALSRKLDPWMLNRRQRRAIKRRANKASDKVKEVMMAMAEILALDEAEESSDEEGEAADGASKPKDKKGDSNVPQAVLERAVRKLHECLGHPSLPDLLRVMQHGGASPGAISTARNLKCNACGEEKRPKIARNATAPRDLQPLSIIGADVKSLPGWLPKQRIKALNLLCLAARYQVMEPLPEGSESAQDWKNAYINGWYKWAGAPDEFWTDEAGGAMSEEFLNSLAEMGTAVMPCAPEAHWQNGVTERHGDLFEQKLIRVISATKPQNYQEWYMCVMHTQHAKNELLQHFGFSPTQHIFGRNKRLPWSLMDEQRCVVSAGLDKVSDVFQRSNDIRMAARLAMLEANDRKAFTTTLDARYRPTRSFCIGDKVAYWRSKKSGGYKKHRPSWYGRALVIGSDGPNLLLRHGRWTIRAAREQCRHTTRDEDAGDNMPGVLRTAHEEWKRSQTGGGIIDVTNEGNPYEGDHVDKEKREEESKENPEDPEPGTVTEEKTNVTTSETSATKPEAKVTKKPDHAERPDTPEAPRWNKILDKNKLGSIATLLKETARPRWTTSTENGDLGEWCKLHGFEGTVDAARIGIQPTTMATPQPYLSDQKGEMRKAVLLMKGAMFYETEWHHWPSCPESTWHELLPKRAYKMLTIFGTRSESPQAPISGVSGSSNDHQKKSDEGDEEKRDGGGSPRAAVTSLSNPPESSKDTTTIVSEEKKDQQTESGEQEKEEEEPANKRSKISDDNVEASSEEDEEEEPKRKLEDESQEPVAKKNRQQMLDSLFANPVWDNEDGTPVYLTKQEVLLVLGDDVDSLIFYGAPEKGKTGNGEISIRNLTDREREEFNKSDEKEWMGVLGRKAIRILTPSEQKVIEEQYPDRIMGSRTVRRWKRRDDGSYSAKSRWCLLGHQDPDLMDLINEGSVASPTITQAGLKSGLQACATLKFVVEFGDISNAFCQGNKMRRKKGKLFARIPSEGIAGVVGGTLIEILVPVYGLNDAPSEFHKSVVQQLQKDGWTRHELDTCLYMLRCTNRKTQEKELAGILMIHVDDIALGGRGPYFLAMKKSLCTRFDFGEWKRDGEFLGVKISQDSTFNICMCMMHYTVKIKPVKIPNNLPGRHPATTKMVRDLRGVLGELGWLSRNTRPDLSAQVNLAQQTMPTPTVSQVRQVNQCVRRALQYKDLKINILSIPLERFGLTVNSDVSVHILKAKERPQAGYIAAAVDIGLGANSEASWSPLLWKSFRLTRAVTSTLSGEAQAYLSAIKELEWLLCLFSEIFNGEFNLEDRRPTLEKIPSWGITDCKSLYDSLDTCIPGGIADRECGLEAVLCRQVLRRTGTKTRWTPGTLQLADGLTKDAGTACDALRSALRNRIYTISDEVKVLERRAAEKEERLRRGKERAESSRAKQKQASQ